MCGEGPYYSQGRVVVGGGVGVDQRPYNIIETMHYYYTLPVTPGF